MINILVGSPIRQKPNILNEFLIGLKELEKEGLNISYYFVDDNTDNKSSLMLSEFSKDCKDVIIQKGNDLISSVIDNEYLSDERGHHWRLENIDRITCFKDSIIEYCIANKFDYLFFIDSDIVLYKKTLKQLVSDNKDIVSEVFWTQWQCNKSLSPQCFWIPDLYKQDCGFNQSLPVEEANEIRRKMVERLRQPGVYPVDGLGACTLITREVLEKGVKFKRIPNLSVQGEDRHFCIRAGALDIKLFMDTMYPAYHIYRDEYLSRVQEFKKEGFKFDMCQTYTDKIEENTEKINIIKKAIRRIKQIVR